SNYLENIEFCTKCGVRLVAKNIKEESMGCPYCGVLIPTSASKCPNCGELLNKSDSHKVPDILRLMSDIPHELKNFKWDDRFVKTNLVIIVGIMGMVIIMMLIIG
ncbi:MAG: hypothetical protein ACXVHU_07870, partial [Methanobacterium sp.]